LNRVAVALIALVLGAAAVPVVGAANAISADPPCRDVRLGKVSGSEDDCFNGSTTRRAVVVGLLYSSALTAAAGLLIGVIAVLRGSRGTLLLLTGILAVLLFVAAYGAVRV
jgi:hypothetical protein